MQKLSGEHRHYTVTLIGLTYLPDFNLSYMALVIAQHNSRLDLIGKYTLLIAPIHTLDKREDTLTRS